MLAEIEPLLNVKQFQQMVPTTTITHMALDSDLWWDEYKCNKPGTL